MFLRGEGGLVLLVRALEVDDAVVVFEVRDVPGCFAKEAPPKRGLRDMQTGYWLSASCTAPSPTVRHVLSGLIAVMALAKSAVFGPMSFS